MRASHRIRCAGVAALARRSQTNDSRPWSWRESALVVLIVFAYASSDEFHQRFVPTRTPLVSDVFIDTGGAVMGMLVLWVLGIFFSWWPKTEIPKSPEAA